MGFMDWMDSKTKNLDGLDIGLLKLGAFIGVVLVRAGIRACRHKASL
jgi:hypothetical protein